MKKVIYSSLLVLLFMYSCHTKNNNEANSQKEIQLYAKELNLELNKGKKLKKN